MKQLFQRQSSKFFANNVILNLAAGTCAVPRLNLDVGQVGLDPALVSDVGRIWEDVKSMLVFPSLSSGTAHRVRVCLRCLCSRVQLGHAVQGAAGSWHKLHALSQVSEGITQGTEKDANIPKLKRLSVNLSVNKCTMAVVAICAVFSGDASGCLFWGYLAGTCLQAGWARLAGGCSPCTGECEVWAQWRLMETNSYWEVDDMGRATTIWPFDLSDRVCCPGAISARLGAGWSWHLPPSPGVRWQLLSRPLPAWYDIFVLGGNSGPVLK